MLDKEKADRLLRRRGWVENENGCWIANGTPNNSGYLSTTLGYRTYGLHRLAYLTWVGDIPEGRVILHTCDVRTCINPAHLRTATYKENSEDAASKDRIRHQESHWNQRLDRSTIIEIYRAAHIGSLSQKDIGAFYGVSQMTVSLIKRKKRWRRFLEDYDNGVSL